MDKEKLADEIKAKTKELNALINDANEAKLKVRFKQEWHPLMNSIGLPINPPLTWEITEEVKY